MQSRLLVKHVVLGLATMLFLLSGRSQAQPTGLLYDPEPPTDSAYVRVLLAGRLGAVDVLVDGKSRVKNLGAGQASDYMVLTAGQHNIALHSPGKSTAQAALALDVVRGRAMTVAFTALNASAVPIVFEDKANSNKLKALLSVYHLDDTAGTLDVLTADGKTTVFSGITYAASKAISVNPIEVELMAVRIGDKVSQSRAVLSMAQGGTYSVLLLPGPNNRLAVRAIQNKIERYTGK